MSLPLQPQLSEEEQWLRTLALQYSKFLREFTSIMNSLLVLKEDLETFGIMLQQLQQQAEAKREMKEDKPLK